MQIPRRMTNKDLLEIIDRNREMLEAHPDTPIILKDSENAKTLDLLVTDLGVSFFGANGENGAFTSFYLKETKQM